MRAKPFFSFTKVLSFYIYIISYNKDNFILLHFYHPHPPPHHTQNLLYLQLPFARRDKISDILYASLFSENPISKEVLKAGSELYPEILEEVLNMTKTLEGDKKVIDKVLKIFVNSVGERKIVDLVGEQKIVDLVGEQKIVDLVGEQKIVDLVGEQKLIQELKKRLSKKDLEKLLIES